MAIERSVTKPVLGAHEADGGWALVSVLWIVSMLAMMAAALQTLTVTSYRSEERALAHTRIDAALDAAIVRSVLGIGDARIEQRWRVDGVPQTFLFAGNRIRVSVQDEMGRYDLNTIDDATLRQLFRALGVDENLSETLTDRIMDWRTKSNGETVRLHGATDADYRAAGLAWRPRHGPFQSLAELQLVLGMTPAIYARVRPALTVYTQRPTIDPQVAPREALLALFAGDTGKTDALLRLRESGPTPESAEPGPATRPGLLNPEMPLTGRAFDIVAEIRQGHSRYSREAVIELTGDSERPYLVLNWR